MRQDRSLLPAWTLTGMRRARKREKRRGRKKGRIIYDAETVSRVRV